MQRKKCFKSRFSRKRVCLEGKQLKSYEDIKRLQKTYGSGAKLSSVEKNIVLSGVE